MRNSNWRIPTHPARQNRSKKRKSHRLNHIHRKETRSTRLDLRSNQSSQLRSLSNLQHPNLKSSTLMFKFNKRSHQLLSMTLILRKRQTLCLQTSGIRFNNHLRHRLQLQLQLLNTKRLQFNSSLSLRNPKSRLRQSKSKNSLFTRGSPKSINNKNHFLLFKKSQKWLLI
jgi:hypothetical protein